LDFNFFANKTPSLVGVDISASAVKMVKLAGDFKSGLMLEAYASSPLEKDLIVDGNIKDLEKVSEVVDRTWKLLSTNVKRTALALPTSSVISKKVLMPAELNEEELNAHVEAEASQYIPFSLDEVNIDFQPLEEYDKETASQSVLIVAAKKENIEDRVAAAEGAALNVEVMDVESYATEAAYRLVSKSVPNKGKNKTVMIMDIGASTTHINVLHNRESVYTRDQHFGGNQLSQDIQRRYGLTFNEVLRSQQFYQTANTNNNKIEHIILAGGGAALTDIDTLIESQTGIETSIANPFEDMEVSKKIMSDKLKQDAPSLFVACGLAMRGLAI